MKFQTVNDVYEAIPPIACQGKCHQSCGVIPLFPAEVDRIQLSGRSAPFPKPNLSCSALVNQHCSIYSDRPLICRLFGVVKPMQCPHGCKPQRWLSDREVKVMMRVLRRLSGGQSAGVLDLEGDR